VAGDGGLDVTGLGLQERGVGVDSDGLLATYREDEIYADGLSYAERDAGAIELLEAGGGDVDAVGAGIELEVVVV
jgi:hypothetical protein